MLAGIVTDVRRTLGERRACRLGFLALVGMKLAVIAVFGPLSQPDSGGYVAYADQILHGSNWFFSQPGGGGDASYRMVGYPLLIAGAKALLGSGWSYGLLVFQAAVGIVATAVVYRFFRRVLPHWGWAIVGAGAYATAQGLVFDSMILTDGIYGSLTAITAAWLGLMASDKGEGCWRIYAAGGLLCAAFLIREATLVLVIAFFPLALLAGHVSLRGRSFYALAIVGFVGPLIIAAGIYSLWNQYRSNAPFITTGMRTAALLPLVKIAGEGRPIFDGTLALDQIAQATLRDFSYEDVLRINRAAEAQGITASDLDKAARAKYWQALFRFPETFAYYALRELRPERRALSLFNPVRSLVQLHEFCAKGSLGGMRQRFHDIVEQRDVVGGLILAADVAFSGIAMALGVLAYFVFPARYVAALISRGPIPAQWNLLGCLWLLYFGVAAAYAMVRLEDRYLIGVAPMALLIGLMMATEVIRYRRGTEG